MIAIDLDKQQELDADPKVLHEINYGNQSTVKCFALI